MITLITGGIKSGKSDFALSLAEKSQKKENFYFLATALPVDKEIRERIRKHKIKRKKFWKTVEEPENIDRVFQNLPLESTVLVDCITLWVGNIMSKLESDTIDFKKIEKKIKNMIVLVREKDIRVFLVTNEVGWGIIPANKLSRIYEDYLGKLNQMLAEYADEVYLMVAGISVKLKG